MTGGEGMRLALKIMAWAVGIASATAGTLLGLLWLLSAMQGD